MKKLCKDVVSIGLVLAFLLALCPLPVALAADLSGAEVSVVGGPLTYHGQPQEPSVTVTHEGRTLVEGTDYTLSYADNINAGEGTVTVRGINSFSGSREVQFTILPYTLTPEDFAGQEPCVKQFGGGTKAEPIIQTTVFGETVTAEYASAAYESKFAGTNTVTVQGLKVTGNYQLEPGFDSLTLEGQILPVQPELMDAALRTGESLDLCSLVLNSKGPYTFYLPEEECDRLGATLSGTILTAGTQTGSIEITADIGDSDVNADGIVEYAGKEGLLVITVTEPVQETPDPVDPPVVQKQPQAPLVISGGDTVTYGQTLQLSCTGGSTNGTVTWGFADIASSGEGTISSAGLLTPVRAGEVWVTATMAGNEAYLDAVAPAVKINILQAPITITAADKAALVGEEVPALTEADYTVIGLVGNDRLEVLPTLSYEIQPDMTQEGEVAILASGATVPAGGNYDPNITYVPGKLTIGPTYAITVNEAEGGAVSADVTQAPEGAAVTLTIQPAEGYVLESLRVESGSTTLETTEAGEGKVTFVMPDGGVMVTPVFIEELPRVLPFIDVTEQDWFCDSVAYVYFNGLMKGTSDTTFLPNGTTTRGMIVTILYRLAGSPEPPDWSPFQDVDPVQYYAEPIAWAAWNGIVNGKTAAAFGPDDPITREQMAAILYRYAEKQGLDVSGVGDLSQFSDRGSISPYAQKALSWANGTGLIGGKGGGILDPQGLATRAEVAAIFHRFCESIPQ